MCKNVCVWLIAFSSLIVQGNVQRNGFDNKPIISFVYDEKAGMYVLQRTKKVNMAMKAVIVAEFGLSAALLMDCSRNSKSKQAFYAGLFGAIAIGVGYSLVQDLLDEYYNKR